MAKDDNGNAREQFKEAASSGDVGGALSALKNKELLTSAAMSAAGALAAAKAPGLVRKLASSTQQKGEKEAQSLGKKAVEGAKDGLGGGGGGIAGKALSKVAGGGGGSGSGGKKTRRLPIQRWTDVALPVDQVYEAWTKFDQFPQFMHRVLKVEQKKSDKISWQEKIWFSTRQWEGRVTERRENDRIVWTTKSGMSHKGIVSFHELSDNLTRVMVDMEFEPNGIMEKMASGLRFVKRAVQADLARFKTYVEMQDAKGIEYRANQQDENEEKDDQNEDEDEQGQATAEEEQDEGGDETSADDEEDDEDADEDADQAVSREDKDEEEREQERKERQERRRERQKSRSR